MYFPSRVQNDIDLRILFSKGHLKLVEEYSNFKPPAPKAEN